MSEATAKRQPQHFGLTWPQKIMYALVPLMFSFFVVIYQPIMTGWLGTVVFVTLGVILGLLSFYVTAGWTFKVEFTEGEIKVRDSRRELLVPMDKVRLVVQNARFPFPVVWLVLRNAEMGDEIPSKGVDAHARALIEEYQRKNPGKKLTIVPIPGGYLRSRTEFAAEIKRRVPQITLDERFGV